jgi:hypothetical protein
MTLSLAVLMMLGIPSLIVGVLLGRFGQIEDVGSRRRLFLGSALAATVAYLLTIVVVDAAFPSSHASVADYLESVSGWVFLGWQIAPAAAGTALGIHLQRESVGTLGPPDRLDRGR